MSTPVSTTTQCGPGVDRRASVRHYPKPDTSGVVKKPRRGRWKAMIHDMSTTGLGMVFNQPFDAGTELAVELQSPDMALLYTVLTRVVHSTRQANGSYLIGCAFLRELSEEELRNLL